MPPKASRATATHEEADSKSANAKEKNGHGNTNGKMRRVASQTGSNLKDVTNSANLPTPAVETAASSVQAPNPSVSWLCILTATWSSTSTTCPSDSGSDFMALENDTDHASSFSDPMVYL